MSDRISVLFDLIASLAIKRGLHPLHKHVGCCELKVDDNWTVAINGHWGPRKYGNVTVDPFTAYVEWCGWPAGIVTPRDGVIAAGSAANEDTLCAALRKAMEGI